MKEGRSGQIDGMLMRIDQTTQPRKNHGKAERGKPNNWTPRTTGWRMKDHEAGEG